MFSDTSVKASAENAFENVKLIATVDERSRDKLFDWNVNGGLTRAGFELVDYLYELKKKEKVKLAGRERVSFRFSKFPITALLAFNAREFYISLFSMLRRWRSSLLEDD